MSSIPAMMDSPRAAHWLALLLGAMPLVCAAQVDANAASPRPVPHRLGVLLQPQEQPPQLRPPQFSATQPPQPVVIQAPARQPGECQLRRDPQGQGTLSCQPAVK